MKPFNLFGTYSHGTLRREDLAAAAIDAAEDLVKWHMANDFRSAAESLVESIGNFRSHSVDDEWFDEALADFIDDMSSDLPAYVYYGNTEGDGSDFGFWLDWNTIETDRRFGEIAAMDDAGNVEDEDAHEALHVNDHGNATMYYRDGDAWRELWSVV